MSAQGGYIYEYTPSGVQSTFASGFNAPAGLALNSAGDLFVADTANGTIVEITPGGVQSTFASGLPTPYGPIGLAFNSAGDLFVSGEGGYIYEYTPSGVPSTLASGLEDLADLAFQPIPEPSVLGLLAVGLTAFLARRRRNMTA